MGHEKPARQSDLTAQRIGQDVVHDDEFDASYYSVRRFVRHLRKKNDLPFRRMDVCPGEEVQVDFGTAAPIVGANTKRRRPLVLGLPVSQG